MIIKIIKLIYILNRPYEKKTKKQQVLNNLIVNRLHMLHATFKNAYRS